MKLKILLACLFVAGIAASFALAAPPPGHGHGKGQNPALTSTSTVSSDRKVALCHKTGSKKNPWVKIVVSKNALPAHLRHGDVPAPAGGCPKAAPTSSTSTPTTTTP